MFYLLSPCFWVGLCFLCQVLIFIVVKQSWTSFNNMLMRYLEHLFCSYRNREIKQMKDSMRKKNSFAFLYHDINQLEHSNQVNLPRVTVIMPLKGFGEHNLHNWRSQVGTYKLCTSGTLWIKTYLWRDIYVNPTSIWAFYIYPFRSQFL